MRCPKCYSENIVKIGRLIYCRNCISFGRVEVFENNQNYPEIKMFSNPNYQLSYELSDAQKSVAEDVLRYYKRKQNVFVQAVCGAGKTELVYPVIVQALREKKKVGFAVPRKDLAIELYQRLASQIHGGKIALVYGGHHDLLYEQLVILTTHQLARYYQYFDLLIIDEVDAFPFYGNTTLQAFAHSACKGQWIYLSATLQQQDFPKDFIPVYLNRRFHDHPLPVPKFILGPDFLFIPVCCFKILDLIKNDHLCLIFCPTKEDVRKITSILRRLTIHAKCIYSSNPDNQKHLEMFRRHQIKMLVTTTLLERGVTFEDVHVFVYKAYHQVFQTSTLIQIAGRVGRKPNYPTGLVYFYSKRKTVAMVQCRDFILQKNAA